MEYKEAWYLEGIATMPVLTFSERVVYLYLYSLREQGNHEALTAALKAHAEAVGCSVSTFHKALGALQENNLITVHDQWRDDGGRAPNRIEVHE